MALAVDAVQVADRNLADRRAKMTGECRNEAMHLAVERNILNHLAAIGFECGSEVVDGNTGETRHDPVGSGRGNAAQDEVIDANFAPAGDDVVTLIKLFNKGGNVIGIVLKVAIHGQDEFARGMVKAGRKGRGLSEIAAQLNDQNTAVYGCDLLQQLIGAVA